MASERLTQVTRSGYYGVVATQHSSSKEPQRRRLTRAPFFLTLATDCI